MRTQNPKALLKAAAAAAKNAHCPYSMFRVGVALLASDGQVFPGCNVENASYGLTVCAERNALAAAVAQGIRKFKALAMVSDGEKPAPPCGACLQVMAEFCAPDFPIYAATRHRPAIPVRWRLADLLPTAFRMDKNR